MRGVTIIMGETNTHDMSNEVSEQVTPLRDIILQEALSWLLLIVITVGVALVLTRFVIVNARIPTASMEPTIMTNDRVIANRFAYRRNNPERYHVVIFRFQGDPTEFYVKRVIGLPGETVEIRAGRVYIRYGDEEPYVARDDFVNTPIFGDYGPFTVPEGHFFVLGDYRAVSEDSRRWADEYRFVPHELLLGRVVVRYFSRPGLIR